MNNPEPGEFPLPKKGEIRVAPLCPIPEVLRDFGVAPGPLLRKFDLIDPAL